MAWAASLATAQHSVEFSLPAHGRRAVRPRPRIGVVIHDFALGGTERIAVRLANEWSKLGVDVHLFCGSRIGPLGSLLHPTVSVFSPAEPIARGHGSLRRLAKSAREHFSCWHADAVYIPGNTHWPVVARLATLPEAKRPRIIAQISAALEKPQRRTWRQRFFEQRMRKKLRNADHVVSMCQSAARQAARILGRDDVIAIPLPALENRDTFTAPPIEASAPVVFAASRLVPGKGVETLVRAFAEAGHATARLVIAGSGPNEPAIRSLVTQLGLEVRVQMLGYVPNILPWLEAASFLVMPSEHEGYGAVIIEALAAGRPVLSTDCSPAVHELLGDSQAGMVVPICDVGALADGLSSMLERPAPDPQALASRVERFRIGPVARRYLQLVGITPGYAGRPARLLLAANDGSGEASDCTLSEVSL